MPATPSGPRSARQWRTAITRIEPNRVMVRGYGLDELMGRASFADVLHLLLTGEFPARSTSMLLDAMLVSFVDHGVTPPSTLAARNAATTGASLRSSVAAGILGFGRHHGGDVVACRALLDRGLALMRNGQTPAEAAGALAGALAASGEIPPPGFGHRYHTVDPRATRLLQLAHELEVDQAHTQLLRALEHEGHVAEVDRRQNEREHDADRGRDAPRHQHHDAPPHQHAEDLANVDRARWRLRHDRQFSRTTS